MLLTTKGADTQGIFNSEGALHKQKEIAVLIDLILLPGNMLNCHVYHQTTSKPSSEWATQYTPPPVEICYMG